MPETYTAPTLFDEAPPVTARYRLSLVREPDDAYRARFGEEPVSTAHPSAAASTLSLLLAGEPFEAFGALYTDTRNRLIGWAILHRGTLNRAAVEPRSVLATGLLLNAAGMIIFHNHPSGDTTPSADDMAFTRRLSQAGEVVGIRLVDHLILGGGGTQWLSLSQRGGW